MSKSTNVCFILVFNFRHDGNINKLEQIYQNRFSERYHLIPFYDGSFPTAIPVYCSSFNWQGYFAESFNRVYQEKYTHYILIGDDLLLNPRLNQDNIIESLQLNDDCGYIKGVNEIVSGVSCGWPHAIRAIAALSDTCYNGDSRQCQSYLPSVEEAARLLSRHGLPWLPLTKASLAPYCSGWRIPCIDKFIESITPQLENGGGYYPYPLAWAYSDLIVVPKKYYRSFCNYCGIFAAMSVFVEIGAPTALLLSCPNIMTESKLPWRGTELWETRDREGIVKNYNGNVSKLLEGFAPNQTYIHPVKLTQWWL